MHVCYTNLHNVSSIDAKLSTSRTPRIVSFYGIQLSSSLVFPQPSSEHNRRLQNISQLYTQRHIVFPTTFTNNMTTMDTTKDETMSNNTMNTSASASTDTNDYFVPFIIFFCFFAVSFVFLGVFIHQYCVDFRHRPHRSELPHPGQAQMYGCNLCDRGPTQEGLRRGRMMEQELAFIGFGGNHENAPELNGGLSGREKAKSAIKATRKSSGLRNLMLVDDAERTLEREAQRRRQSQKKQEDAEWVSGSPFPGNRPDSLHILGFGDDHHYPKGTNNNNNVNPTNPHAKRHSWATLNKPLPPLPGAAVTSATVEKWLEASRSAARRSVSVYGSQAKRKEDIDLEMQALRGGAEPIAMSKGLGDVLERVFIVGEEDDDHEQKHEQEQKGCESILGGGVTSQDATGEVGRKSKFKEMLTPPESPVSPISPILPPAAVWKSGVDRKTGCYD